MKDNRKVYRCAYGMLKVVRNSEVDEVTSELGIQQYLNSKQWKLEIDLKYPQVKNL